MFRSLLVALPAALASLSVAYASPPAKWIKLTNDSASVVYPIIQVPVMMADLWLQAQFQVPAAGLATRTYATSTNYRLYVGGTKGMVPGSSIYVQLPFYTQLKPGTGLDGSAKDQYIDWWNGGRIYFYDTAAQVSADYSADSAHPVTPTADGPVSCKQFVSNACASPTPVTIVSNIQGLPTSDKSQLAEYTFGDVLPGSLTPYQLDPTGVGYDVSAVDQVYLPLAMQPFGNPFIPYIGTTMKVGTFRTKLQQFLKDFPGWPVYAPAVASRPRIPGAYNVFASGVDLTAPGAAVQAMKTLYQHCTTNVSDTSSLCVSYREVNDLMQTNYNSYKALACADPKISFSGLVLSKIYGWVPFNENCGGANALNLTYGSTPAAQARFLQVQHDYIRNLQYAAPPSFNPYVSLIHGSNYLNMQAYAFSIDDAVGFQHFPGTGLILDYGGSTGLTDKAALDTRKEITITLGLRQTATPEWSTYAIACGTTGMTGDVNPKSPVFQIWPQSFPCTVSATDIYGRQYSFDVTQGPPNTTPNCPSDVPDAAWCRGVQAPPAQPNNIDAPAIEPPPS